MSGSISKIFCLGQFINIMKWLVEFKVLLHVRKSLESHIITAAKTSLYIYFTALSSTKITLAYLSSEIWNTLLIWYYAVVYECILEKKRLLPAYWDQINLRPPPPIPFILIIENLKSMGGMFFCRLLCLL